MKPPVQIAIFNHKGGVSKTTSTFHLGWKLAELGKTVVLIDCDPQCNLTGLILQYSQDDDYPFESTDRDHPKNIRDALAPAFEARPAPLRPIVVQPVKGIDNLFIAPGHIGLAEYESTLAIAHELSGSLSALQNIPGSLRWVFDLTAQSVNADIVLIDMSPSLGAINQNILSTSDAFIVPMAPDFFSSMALRSLSRVLPKWKSWSEKAAQHDSLIEAAYPWPKKNPRYIGSIVQNYRQRSRDGGEAKPTKAYGRWFDELAKCKAEKLIPELRQAGMLFDENIYSESGAPLAEFLIQVPDFNSLIAISQTESKPVFELTQMDLKNSGSVAENQINSIENFNKIYKNGAQKILKMCEIAE